MPDKGGIETLREILAKDPKARVVMLTTSDTEEDVYRAIEDGALGYVMKESSVETIVAAIHAAQGREGPFPARDGCPQVGGARAGEPRDWRTSRHQREQRQDASETLVFQVGCLGSGRGRFTCVQTRLFGIICQHGAGTTFCG